LKAQPGDGCHATGSWLYSKNHPNIYDNNLRCTFNVTEAVAITATSFDTEPG
jgi:hypothetical protein